MEFFCRKKGFLRPIDRSDALIAPCGLRKDCKTRLRRGLINMDSEAIWGSV